MNNSTTEAPPRDALLAAMDALDAALDTYAWWPWSRRRRRKLIVALNTVLELHFVAVARSISYGLARLEVQQGRHELRIAHLERGQNGGAREVGA